MALGPVADRRQARAEVVGDDVVGLADEDRLVADPRKALDVLDHLGVVVGRQERLALAAGRHRQPADEVGQPGEGRLLELRVLVQVVVDIPRLVADDEVVFAALDDVVEDHEVVDEDLVHPADRLERVEVVLGRLGGDVRGLGGELGAHRVDPLAVGLEDRGDRMLGEPVDLEVGVELPQLAGDRHVALRMTEPDRGRDVQRASSSGAARSSRSSWARRSAQVVVAAVTASLPKTAHEVADQQVHQDRSRACGMWPPPSTTTSGAPVQLAPAARRRAIG